MNPKGYGDSHESFTWSYQCSRTTPLPPLGSPELRLISWAPAGVQAGEVVPALQAAIEAKDPHLYAHSANVGTYARLLGRALGYPELRCQELYHAGFFHDVGKIGISDAILHKPGRLSAAERRVMMEHPAIGARILAGVPSLGDAMQAAHAHQELYDGTGYPRGLAGERIPLVARIVTIVDAFDAMSTSRVYRVARPMAEILEEMERLRGIHFDPALTDVFLRLAGTEEFRAAMARRRQVAATPAAAPPADEPWLHRLERLARVSRGLNDAGQQADILSRAAGSVKALLDADATCAWLLQGELLLPRAMTGCAQGLGQLRVSAGDEGLSSFVTYRQMAVAVPDFEEETRFVACPRLQESGIRSALAAPVMLTGEVLGVLTAYFRVPRSFDEADVALLTTLADQVAVALDNERLTQATARAVNVDPLTGARNHRSFQEVLRKELAGAEQADRPLGVLLLDVDGFEDFNEAHGHAIGDEALRLLAQVLQRGLRPGDVVGRHGGDSFAIVLPGLDHLATAEVGRRLQQAVSGTAFPRRELAQARITVSVGGAAFPSDGNTARQLLASAQSRL